jgi:hypothetical protein
MPLFGAEMHVLTLLETLKMRRAVGLDTYALFVDIKGAYDNVPQGPLAHPSTRRRARAMWCARCGEAPNPHGTKQGKLLTTHPPEDEEFEHMALLDLRANEKALEASSVRNECCSCGVTGVAVAVPHKAYATNHSFLDPLEGVFVEVAHQRCTCASTGSDLKLTAPQA